MTKECPKGYYWDGERCRKSISAKRKGIYPPHFTRLPQDEQYKAIESEMKKEGGPTVVRQMSFLNSATTHDSPEVHRAAHNDLEYAAKLDHESGHGKEDEISKNLDERNKAGTRKSDLMRAYGAHNEEELDRRLRDKYNSLGLGSLTDEKFKNLKDTESVDERKLYAPIGGCPKGEHMVHGFERKDGTYVKAHCAKNPRR